MKPWIVAVALWCLRLTLQAQPDNDHFVHRSHLSGQSVSVPFYLLDATMEPGEVELFLTRGQSIWFEWTAPEDGHFQVLGKLPDTESGSINHPQVWVSVGDELSSLQLRFPSAGFPDAPYVCTKGEIFQIALVRREEAFLQVGLAGVMEIRFIPLPENDHFEERIRLSGETIHQTVWLDGTKPEPDLPTFPHALAWWTWAAPADGEVEFACESAGWLGVFQGEQLPTLNLVSSTDSPRLGVRFPVIGGQSYQFGIAHGNSGPVTLDLQLTRPLRLVGVDPAETLRPPVGLELAVEGFVNPSLVTNLVWWSSAAGELRTNRLVSLSIAELIGGEHRFAALAECSDGLRYHLPETIIRAVHANDSFAFPRLLEGDRVEFTADPRGASLETGEQGTTGSIWWQWVAPFSGRVQFHHLDEGLGATMELWAGSSVEQLIKVADGLVVAGVTYAVRASGGQWYKGRYQLELLPVPVPNDDFDDAIVLSAAGMTNRVELSSATAQAGEPAREFGQLGQSVWYAFTPPTSGLLRCQVTGPEWATLESFAGETLTSLQRLSSDLFVRVVEGQPHRLRLAAGSIPAGSRAELRFAYFPSPPNDDFAAATLLEGESVSFVADLGGATAEAGQPSPAAGAWWRWIPPRNGWAVLQASDQAKPPAPRTSGSVLDYAVFRGTSLATLTNIPVAWADGEAIGFLATAGQPYFIHVSGVPGNAPVEVHLDLSELIVAVQQGDTVIPSGEAQVRQWFALGKLFRIEATSPAEFTAGDDATLRVQVPDHLADVQVSWRQKEFYTSPRFVGYRTLLANVGADVPCVVSNLPAGWHEFHVAIEAPDGTAVPSLSTVLKVYPENDAFAKAMSLTGHSAWTSGTLSTASLEVGEPPMGAPANTSSVWYRWQAPADGNAIFHLQGQSHLRMRVFQGGDLASLTETDGQRFEDSLGTQVLFRAEAEKAYWIAVGSVADPRSALTFDFQLGHGLETTRWAKPLVELYAEGEAIPLDLNSTEPAGAVEFCEFAANDAVVVRLTEPPWRWEWPSGIPGTHRIAGRLQLKSGEVVAVNERTIRIRPHNLDFANPLPVSGSAGVVQLGPNPRDFGPTNRSWFQWTAPADGFLILRPVVDAQLFLAGADGSFSALTNQAPAFADWLAFGVQAETSYVLGVVHDGGWSSSVTLSFEIEPPLVNDDFEHATQLSGINLELRIVPWLASAQPGEPAHGYDTAQHSQWWRWTAPNDGYLKHPLVYVGGRLDQLTRLATGPHGVPVVRGTSYWLVVDTGTPRWGVRPLYDYVYRTTFVPLVSNDHFANRTPLAGRRAQFSGDLELATAEPGDPLLNPNQAGNTGRTAWWTWTAPVTGPVWLHRLPDSHDLRMAVFRGTVLKPQMERVAYGSEQLRFNAQAGEVFQIAVEPWGTPVVAFELVSEAIPPNDLFVDRQPIPAQGGQVAGWNFGAHREFQEPVHAGRFGGRSVWYRWRPSSTGQARLKLDGDLLPALMAVYQEQSDGQITPVIDLVELDSGNVSFTALAGQDYAIAIDGLLGATGDFTLEAIILEAFEAPSLSISENGQAVSLHYSSHPTVSLRLEGSQDFEHWEPVLQIPPGTAPAALIAPMDDNARYYRLVPASAP